MGHRVTVTNPCSIGNHPNCQAPNDCQCACHQRRAPGIKKGKDRHPDYVLEWEEPPGVKRRTTAIVDRVRPMILDLKRNPKRWARLALYYSKTGAGQARKKCADEFTDCEFTARTVEDGVTGLFGRFMGEP